MAQRWRCGLHGNAATDAPTYFVRLNVNDLQNPGRSSRATRARDPLSTPIDDFLRVGPCIDPTAFWLEMESRLARASVGHVDPMENFGGNLFTLAIPI